MKAIIPILVISFLTGPVLNGQKEKGNTTNVIRWVIQPQSNLQINGKSNVNTFQCGITEFLHTDTLVYTHNDPGQQAAKLKGTVVIDINRFDCGHKYITSDLRKTLKADENPNLLIRFVSMDKFIQGQGTQPIKGIVEIELAGVKKQYEVSYVLQNHNTSQVQLMGSRTILFSDFNLKPPSRLAGLIKVAEEITVQFQLMLKTL